MNNKTFPYGIHLCNFDSINQEITIPYLFSSEKGGIIFRYDNQSENFCNEVIENVALSISLPLVKGLVKYHVFDYSHRKRFHYLSELAADQLYSISLSEVQAQKNFDILEAESINRHHERLSINFPTLSDYNKNQSRPLPYHVLIINLAHYPESYSGINRWNKFLEAAFQAGFYCIGFLPSDLEIKEKSAIDSFFKYFPVIDVVQNKLEILEIIDESFPLQRMQKWFSFSTVDQNKNQIVQQIKEALSTNSNENLETNFISIPVAKTLDGSGEIRFELGQKSDCYHAILTGRSGTGKSVFLNNLIATIAEKYTASQIRLDLMDYKEGVEFNQFANHPNVEHLFLSETGKLDSSSKQAAFVLLETFIRNGTQLAAVFRKENIKNIDEYNKKHPEAILPHRILIIDEIQRIYENMNFQETDKLNNLLKQILTQGRAWGIHLLICTQTLSRQIGLPLSTFQDQSKLRITFALADGAAEYIMAGKNTIAPSRLGKYEVLLNNNGGQINANRIGHAFPPKDIADVINLARMRRVPSEITNAKIIRSTSDEEDGLNSNNSLNENDKKTPPIDRASELFGSGSE